MASNKAVLLFLLTMFLVVNVGMCDGISALDQLLPSLGQVGFLQDAQCMQRLIPCQTYVKSPTNPPPQACCDPLKEMHENETQCLCHLLAKPSLLQSINVSKEDLMKLPQACGINADISLDCNNPQGPAAQVPSSPAAEGEGAVPEIDNSEFASSAKMITPYGITYFGLTGFVGLLSALVFSSY